MQFNQPQLEKRPSEIQIRDCAEQLRSQGRSNYGDSVKKYAQLRLADLAPLLEDWQNEAYAAALKQTTLPKIAAAINAKLSPAQCEKLLAVLQQFSEQGNTTAMLYLAYLYSQGIHTESSLRKTAHYLQLAASKKDWRANHLWAELLVAAPLAARDLIGDEIQADVEKWHAEMPKIDPKRIEQALRRFYDNPAAMKYAAKAKLVAAKEQGSPIAEQRIKGLTMLGALPHTDPAPQYRKINHWLDVQLLRGGNTETVEDDILIMPENVPFLPQDEDDGIFTEQWRKLALYTGIALVALLVFTLLIKLLV